MFPISLMFSIIWILTLFVRRETLPNIISKILMDPFLSLLFYGFFMILLVVIPMWSFFTYHACLSEVHQISFWNALMANQYAGTVFLPFVLILVIILIITTHMP